MMSGVKKKKMMVDDKKGFDFIPEEIWNKYSNPVRTYAKFVFLEILKDLQKSTGLYATRKLSDRPDIHMSLARSDHFFSEDITTGVISAPFMISSRYVLRDIEYYQRSGLSDYRVESTGALQTRVCDYIRKNLGTLTAIVKSKKFRKNPHQMTIALTVEFLLPFLKILRTEKLIVVRDDFLKSASSDALSLNSKGSEYFFSIVARYIEEIKKRS